MSPLKMKEMKDSLEKKTYDTLKAKHVSLENKHVLYIQCSTDTTKPWAIIQGFFQKSANFYYEQNAFTFSYIRSNSMSINIYHFITIDIITYYYFFYSDY